MQIPMRAITDGACCTSRTFNDIICHNHSSPFSYNAEDLHLNAVENESDSDSHCKYVNFFRKEDLLSTVSTVRKCSGCFGSPENLSDVCEYCVICVESRSVVLNVKQMANIIE